MMEQKDFIRIILENEKVIFKITTFYAYNEDDRKDLYQEIVLQLWKAYPNFRKEAKISTWLYRIALNTAISQIRKNKKEAPKVPISQIVLQVSDSTDNDKEEKIQMLYKQIEQLNQLEKAIILLYLEDKSHEEIAEVIGLTITNVGTRLSRIKQKIKEQIINI